MSKIALKPEEIEDAETVGGDGEDGDLNIEVLEDEPEYEICPWSKDPDEHRRAFIIREMASADIDGAIMVSNMDAVYRWLRDCALPVVTKKK